MPRADYRKSKKPSTPTQQPAEASADGQSSAAPAVPSPTFASERPAAGGGAIGIPARGLRTEGSRFRAPLATIAPNPRNVRDDDEWDEEEFADFVGNLDEVGVIQDAVVVSKGAFLEKYPQYADKLAEHGPEVEWVLLAGERRYRAHVKLQRSDMTVVLRNQLLAQGDFAFMSENGRRRALNPLQEGELCARIHREEGLTFEQIARKGGLPGGKARVSKLIRLFDDFPHGDAREAIRKGLLPAEAAYHLLTKLADPVLIEQGYALMVSESLTAQKAVRRLTGAVEEPPPAPIAAEPARHTGNGSATAEASQPGEVSSDHEGGPSDATSAGELGDAVAALPTSPAADATGNGNGASADGQVSPAKPRQSTAQAAARLTTLRKLLETRDYTTPHPITVGLATAVITAASAQQLQIAATAAGIDPATAAPARLADADAVTLVRLGDAAGLAGAELRLRSRPRQAWGHHEAVYLRQLTEAGYGPSADETEFLTESSSALPTPTESTS
ncbi:hypothetical protein [Planomonospora sp. ID82291]|uniref:hypothetical protein n=1 Tax=Planomonospora sp. ID82291 TaxID=2738136 RepID=UPI0018C35BE6|nr:hypothetical protein [Planomonospora sp. ID82291]MBG0818743.1 hypothetical protein [Planomonospora sp. ID82291]